MKKQLTKRLTKAEKRVAVAKDALKQLHTEKYLAETGTYIGCNIDDTLGSDWRPDQAQKELKTMKPCSVCARGALLLSAVRKFNEATVSDVLQTKEWPSADLFGWEQLSLIEAAFELWEENGGKPMPKAFAFGNKFTNDHDRLVAILKNVIKNNGTFKP